MADGGEDSDYIYIGTCANATWHQYHLNVQTTLNGMVKDGKLPAGTDTKEMAAEIVRSVFGVGTFDETYSSGWDPVIIAVNKTTFKAEVVFRESDIRKDYPNIFVGYPTTDPGFNVLAGYRMVCRFNDKLYFVSMGQPTATLVEVDPYTNEAQIAYYNNRFNRVVASGVHGLIVYDGEILMCLATDNYDGNKTPGGIIVASSDPSADLSKWRVIADQDDFDNLPAVMNTDGLNGGGIWDIIEYNGHLYVTVVTDKNIDGKINKQGFAMYRGDKDSNGNFTWEQIIGNKTGSKYGYGLGIDHSMSCNLWVYNGYLYMGTYNDPMLDLAEVPATGNFELLYNDLDHSIYLYRMDANENFEQVAGKNDNPYFPNGPIGNLGAGLGNNSNQYVWRMGEHNGEFYIGTYDTATITYKFTQITDGQLRDMKYDDIRGRADELQKALERALGEYGDNVLFQWFLRKTVFSDYTLQLIQKLAGFATDMSADKNPVPDYRQMLSDYEAFKAKVYGILDTLRLTDAVKFAAENPKATAQLLAEDVSVASISTMSREDKFNFVNTMKERIKAMLDEIFKVYDTVVYDETIHNFVYYFGCNYYSQKSEPGFDLLVSKDGVNFDVITSDGFGDPANHGLRCITSTEQGVFLGTANPYYATQLWLMHSDADKPVEVVPEAPVATNIPTDYIVSCVTENSGHGADTMNLIADTFTIGEVTKDGNNYVCPITIATAKYAEAYSVENGKHTAKEASITFNMTWNGKAWEAPEMTQLPVIKVECKATEPEAPEAPVATNIPTAYIVSCVTENSGHGADTMDLIDGTFTIGDVTKDGDNYVCPITIATAKYAEAYSVENGKHTAKEESITFNMTWDGQEWKAPEMTDLPQIKVECKATEPEAPKAPAETALPSAYLVSCTTNDAHADVWMLAIPGADTIGEVTKEGETYICPITVSTKEYAEEYSAATVINKPHTALEETVTYTMTWDGQKWVAPKRADLPVIELKCEATEPEAPKAPEATNIPTAYIVSCVTENSNHGAAQMNLIADTFTIGEVAKEGNNYVCPITIATAKYAEAYSVENGKHTAKEASITFNMTWDGKAWKAPAMTQLPVIELKCEATKPDPKPDPETYTVTVVGSEAAITGAGKYEAGKLVTIDAGMRLGYTFAGWTANGDVSLGNWYSSSTTFTMPKYDVTLTANWRLTPIDPTPSIPSVSNLYPIEILDTTNGAVTSSHKYASAGTTVTLTVNPAAGYTLGSLTAYTSNKVDLKLTDKGEGKYTFTMPASKVFVASVFNPVNGRFVDVPSGSYFEEAVNWAVANGITTGTSATTFDPDGICTRAQAVTFLWRAAGSPAPANSATPFTDVAAGSYYAQAVAWAVENGITKGTSDTTFSPDAHCSRAQIVTFLWRAQKSPVVTAANPFADVSVDAYYVNAIQWAVSEGVTTGTSAVTFSPDADCTRAQIVTFIWRALGK